MKSGMCDAGADFNTPTVNVRVTNASARTRSSCFVTGSEDQGGVHNISVYSFSCRDSPGGIALKDTTLPQPGVFRGFPKSNFTFVGVQLHNISVSICMIFVGVFNRRHLEFAPEVCETRSVQYKLRKIMLKLTGLLGRESRPRDRTGDPRHPWLFCVGRCWEPGPAGRRDPMGFGGQLRKRLDSWQARLQLRQQCEQCLGRAGVVRGTASMPRRPQMKSFIIVSA